FVMFVPRDKHWNDPMMFVLALGLTAGIFGQVVFYLFDHFYEDQRIALLYVYMGLLLAVLKIKSQQLSQRSDAPTTTEQVRSNGLA
ncbi:hypothetical protein, partial [Methylophaga lonarensis]|uniref:hypothetical protein n=1 Tax=Methylophaga lonarensis TaxID=999151 RepID=UPI003D2B1357